MRKIYHDQVQELVLRKEVKVGDEVRVSCVNVLQFVEKAIKDANKDNFVKRWIAEAFEMCGLNPYVTSNDKFKQHLDRLESHGAYNALIKKWKEDESVAKKSLENLQNIMERRKKALEL